MRLATFHGPNPYSGERLVLADMTVDETAASRSDAIIEEIGRLSASWYGENEAPGIEDPSEALVDFMLRWSLAALNWMQGFLELYGYRKIGTGRFRIWVAFHDPGVTNSALALAVRLANRAEQGRVDAAELENMLGRLWDACKLRHPDTSDHIVMMGARALDLPVTQAWNTMQMWQYGWGARSEVIGSAATNRDGYASGMVIARKNRTKNALRGLGLPVPPGVLVRTDKDIENAVEEIGFPCVVKPIDLAKGKGISANLKTIDEVRSAVRYAQSQTSLRVMIEAFIAGDDHRLLMAGGQLAVAVRRLPPAVIGDGKHTIRELTDALNIGRVHPDTLSLDRFPAVRLDENAVQHLKNQGLTPETVLPTGQEVTLRSIANISTGGSTDDVTAKVHPDIRQACEMIARTLQVNVAGFDYMTTDISRSWREVPGAFIELNLTPALIAFTLAGWPAAEAGKLILSEQTGRIPLNLIVIPDDSLEEAETRLANLPGGTSAGWASQGKACIGTLPLIVESGPPWSGIRTLLAHRTVERATVLATSEQIQVHGLPVDRADRIWNCDHTLRGEWREVLDRSSKSPVQVVAWSILSDELATSQGTYPAG
ncbi:MAG: hypothetical protein R3E09_16570 [Novosphingobium sp.]